MHLVQLRNEGGERRVALVVGNHLCLLKKNIPSVYHLALSVIDHDEVLSRTIEQSLTHDNLDYDEIYEGQSNWKILPAIDHPINPSECYVSGTGLTHKSSAANRQNMHLAEKNQGLTDSMKMYLWGEKGGKPVSGKVGVQPEWFYKGNGSILRAHGQPLQVPEFGDDGGEEPEIAGIYLVAKDGWPYRIGFTTGNEFSDHVMEKKNYLYLAPSKLRPCAIGPELVLSDDFSSVNGLVRILRNDKILWTTSILSGTQNMAHSLSNLEHHHFKYEQHRLLGQVHVHFFGAADFSFGHNLRLQHGDVMEVSWEKYGRALRNPIEVLPKRESTLRVKPLWT